MRFNCGARTVPVRSMMWFIQTERRNPNAGDCDICGLRLYAENENVTAHRAYEKLGMTEAHYKIYEEIFRAS